MRRTFRGRLVASLAAVGALLVSAVVGVQPAAAADVQSVDFAFSAITPTTQTMGQTFTFLASLSCSAVQGATCNDVAVTIPFPADAEPALGAAQPSAWNLSTNSSTPGLVDSYATRDTVKREWVVKLKRPVASGESVAVVLSVSPSGTATARGMTAELVATLSGSNVEPVTADGITITPTAIGKAWVTKTLTSASLLPGGRAQWNLEITDGRYPGYPLTQNSTRVLVDKLPANVSYASSSPEGVYDPEAHTVTWSGLNAAGNLYVVNAVVKGDVKAGALVKNQAEFHFKEVGSTADEMASAETSTSVVGDLNAGKIFSKTFRGNLIPGTTSQGNKSYTTAGLEDETDVESFYDLVVKQDSNDTSWTFSDELPCLTAATATTVSSNAPGALCAAPAFKVSRLTLTSDSVVAVAGDATDRSVDLTYTDGTTETVPLALAADVEVPAGKQVARIASSGDSLGGTGSVTFRLWGRVDASLAPTVTTMTNTMSAGVKIMGNVPAPTTSITATATLVRGLSTASVSSVQTVTMAQNSENYNAAGVGLFAAASDRGVYDTRKTVVVMPDVPMGFEWSGTPGAAVTTDDWMGTGRWAAVVSPGATYVGAYMRAKDNAPGLYTYDVYTGFPGVQFSQCLNTSMTLETTNDIFLDDTGIIGAPGELTTVCHRTGKIIVSSPTPGFTLEKSVKSASDVAWAASPGTSSVSAGGSAPVSFKVSWTNTGSVDLASTTIYDLLPAPGDTGSVAGLAGVERGSTMRPVLSSVIAPWDWRTSYSTAANPCRPEVTGVDPSCTDDWTTTAPALSKVTALKFVKASASAKGYTADFLVSMTAPAFDIDQDVAWNTVAARSEISGGTVGALVPVESPKVGFGRVLTPEIGILTEVCAADSCDADAAPGTGGWASTADVPYGAEVTWRTVVTNTGTAPLTDVTLVDTALAGCAGPVGDLAAGASAVKVCTGEPLTSDVTRDASVTAQGMGTTVSATTKDGTPASVTVGPAPEPDIRVLKQVCLLGAGCDVDADADDASWGAEGTVDYDGTVLWRAIVTNSGETDLTNIRVVDTVADCSAVVDDLAIGGTTTTSCVSTNVTQPLESLVDVRAAGPGSWGDVKHASMATVVPGAPVPSLSVVKEVCTDEDACSETAATGTDGWAKTTTVDYFSPVVWRVVVTNSGQTPLTQVAVADPLVPGCEIAPVDLAVGESRAVSCLTDNATISFPAVAAASGMTPSDDAVSASDGASVVVRPMPLSSMSVVVESCDPAAGDCLDTSAPGEEGWGDGTAVLYEGDVVWRVTVTNTGQTDLTDVSVAGLDALGCSVPERGLAPGESMVVTCPQPAVGSDTALTTSVSAGRPFGLDPLVVEETGTVQVAEPVAALDVLVEVCTDLVDGCDEGAANGEGGWGTSASVPYDSTLQWRVTVTNTGQTDFDSAEIVSSSLPGCSAVLTNIPRGGQVQHLCETAGVRESVDGLLTLTATDTLGHPVEVEGSAEVTVGSKPTSAVGVYAESCDPTLFGCADDALIGEDGWLSSTTVAFHGEGLWRVTAVNTGATTLTDIAVVTDLVLGTDAAGCTFTVDSLAPGARHSVTCAQSAVDGLTTVTATVTATPPYGDAPLSGVSVPAGLTSVDPVVGLTVSAEICSTGSDCDRDAPSLTGGWAKATEVEPGQAATWRVVTTNTGEVPVTDVTVTAGVAACSTTLDSLAAGAVHVTTCTTDGLLETMTDTVTVTATDPRAAAGSGAITEESTVLATVRDYAAAVTVVKESCVAGAEADCLESGTGWSTAATGAFGAEAWWRITVRNTGDTPLTAVLVTDAKFPAGNMAIDALPAGESRSVVFSAGAWTVTDRTDAKALNTAEVTAADVAGKTVVGSASATAAVRPEPAPPVVVEPPVADQPVLGDEPDPTSGTPDPSGTPADPAGPTDGDGAAVTDPGAADQAQVSQTTGTGTALAQSGADALAGKIAVAILLLLVGAGAVVVVARRRRPAERH